MSKHATSSAPSKRATAAEALGARSDLRYGEKQLLAADRLEELFDRLQRRARWYAWGMAAIAFWQGLVVSYLTWAKWDGPVDDSAEWMRSLGQGTYWFFFFASVGFALHSAKERRVLARLRAELGGGDGT